LSAGFNFLFRVNCGELNKIDDVRVTNFTPIRTISPGNPTPAGGMGRSFDEHIVCRVEMAVWMDFAKPIDLMVQVARWHNFARTGTRVGQVGSAEPTAFERSHIHMDRHWFGCCGMRRCIIGL